MFYSFLRNLNILMGLVITRLPIWKFDTEIATSYHRLHFLTVNQGQFYTQLQC